MAVDRVPVLKRCRSLDLDPDLFRNRQEINEKINESQQKDERVCTPAEREAESKIHLRCVRETV